VKYLKQPTDMKIEQLLLLQIVAHFLTDYIFQTDKKAEEKNKNGFKSKFLKWHVFIAFCFSWILSFQCGFIYGAIAIAFSHWLIDGLKVHINRSKRLGEYAYFIDQAVHLVLIAGIVLWFDRYLIIKPLFNFAITTKHLAIFTGFLFCSKPANILIKETFHVFDIHINKSGAQYIDLPNAGKLIGIIERWLVLLFIILNQFEAVGFLITAKSILRYKTDETLKTEYVLTGTMLSFGIAIVTGIIVNRF
jgi:hypothetical protein